MIRLTVSDSSWSNTFEGIVARRNSQRISLRPCSFKVARFTDKMAKSILKHRTRIEAE